MKMQSHEVWLAARDIIAQALQLHKPNMDMVAHEHNAAAIIAKLLHHDPPLRIVPQGGFADDDEQLDE